MNFAAFTMESRENMLTLTNTDEKRFYPCIKSKLNIWHYHSKLEDNEIDLMSKNFQYCLLNGYKM
jgi:hypothetical protein